MGWQITCTENTLFLTAQQADALWEVVGEEFYDDYDDFLDGEGRPQEPEDTNEHADYYHWPNVQEALTRTKARGRILWTKSDGDGGPCDWGYEFDGLGNYKKLTGKVVWE